MIDFYYWTTPNGWKISIALEELGLPYKVHPIDIGKGAQFEPAFLKISPNNRIPAIVDPDGPGGQPISVFESGAILIYLAEKTGKLLGSNPQERLSALEWLMWQMGGLGPMSGQNFHFRFAAPEQIPYALDRYSKEVSRLYGVMDKRLQENTYLAGKELSIADIACWPWIVPYEKQGKDLKDFPSLKRWFDMLAQRPSFDKGKTLPAVAT